MTHYLSVSKDSNGDFLCPVCGKSYMNKELASECMETHDGDRDILALDRVKTSLKEISASFGVMDGNANTLGVNERLVLMMMEDYVLSRERDLVDRGKVSPLSMQLSKNVNEALSNLNKLKYGTKSLSVSAKAEQGPGTVYDILDKVLAKEPKPVKVVSEKTIKRVISD